MNIRIVILILMMVFGVTAFPLIGQIPTPPDTDLPIPTEEPSEPPFNDENEDDDDESDDGNDDDGNGDVNQNGNGDFRTQTQGGWGSSPKGNNPGRYLHDNFDKAFPNGVKVGLVKTLRFTTAQAITDYLPSGGKPEALTKTEINPKKGRNNLAAQTLALTLSVGFDISDSDFGASSTLLRNLKINSGKFKGWTVEKLLWEANKTLGGTTSAYTPSELNETLAKCNQCFVDGNRSTGFLGVSESGGIISAPRNNEGKGKKNKPKGKSGKSKSKNGKSDKEWKNGKEREKENSGKKQKGKKSRGK